MHKIFIICFLLLFAGCGKTSKKNFQERHQLNLAFKYNPLTIDPRKNSDPLSCSLINMLFEGLVHEEPDGSLTMGLAESYEIEKNGTKYIFHLKNAKWSNGIPITAYDFEYSWKKILDPSFTSINAYFLYPIKNAQLAKKGVVPLEEVGIKAEDDFTLVVKLEQPASHFLKRLAFPTFFPIWHKQDAEKVPGHPFGVFSGPFVLEEWQSNHFLTLKKNPYFWDQQNTKLSTIQISVVPDEITAFRLFEQKEIDWLGSFFSPIPLDMFASIKKLPSAFSTDIAATTLCFFNVNCYPFNNLNIRKAFCYALNKKEIVEHFAEGGEKIAYGLIPPILKEHSNSRLMAEGSKELAKHYFHLGLKELGITEEQFPLLTFTYMNTEQFKELSQIFQETWQEVLGVQIAIESLETKILIDKMQKKNFQFSLLSIIAQYPDAYNFLERFADQASPKNFTGWYNEDFKKLLEYSNEASSLEARENLLEKAESILMMETPIIPIFYQTRWYMKNDFLSSVQTCTTGRVDFRYADFTR